MARPKLIKGGRPKKPIDWHEAEKLCAIQCTQLEIADWFNISVDTLARRLRSEKGICFKEFFAQNNPDKICGKIKGKNGYVWVKICSSNFFYPMARKDGWILEHRLVVAQRIGRCLHSWEIVHHKDHVRDHNSGDNLQLVSDDRHKQITILENKIDRLLRQNKELKTDIRLMRWEMKERMDARR